MNILLAIDGSECSEAAILKVLQTAPKDAQIRIITVIEPFPVVESWAYAVNWPVVLEGQRKEAAAFVAEAAKTFRDRNFAVSTIIEEGNAKPVIVDTAAKWPADLVVLGSHGRRGLPRFLLGSVSEGVVRHAPCSVLVVR
jgi:nucleotide-binding universal stress UspA family protein